MVVPVGKNETFLHDDGVEISVRRSVMRNVRLKFSKVRLTNLTKFTPRLHSFLFIKKSSICYEQISREEDPDGFL